MNSLDQLRYPRDLIELVQEASVGVALVGKDGLIRWANKAEHERLGIPREEYVGKEYRRFFSSLEDGDLFLTRLFAGGVLTDYHVTLRDHLGNAKIVAVDANVIARGQDAHARLLTRDVTGSVLAEREREDLLQREHRARLAAEKAVARTATLQEVTALLSSASTQQEMAEIIVVKGAAAIGAQAGAVALREADECVLKAAFGYDKESLTEWRRFDLSGRMPLSYTIRTGEELFLSAEQAEERFPNLVNITQHRAWAAVPIRANEEVTGAFGLSFAANQSFADEDRDLMRTLARLCSQALDRARLYDLERNLRSEAQDNADLLSRVQRVTDAALGHPDLNELPQILQTICDVLECDTIGILLLDESDQHLYPVASIGLAGLGAGPPRIPVGQGFVGTIAATRKPLIVEDPSQFQFAVPAFAQRGLSSVAGIPLLADGKVTGVLHVGVYGTRKFGARHVRLLELVADRVALAIAQSRLFEAERQARSFAEDAEARYRLLAETMPQIVWAAGQDGSVDYYNEQFFNFAGLEQGQASLSDWQGLVHPDDAQSVFEGWQRSLVTGERFEMEFRIKRSDGVYCWFLQRALPRRDASGTIVRWLGTLTDIDEQKRAQERLSFLAEASAILSSSLDYEQTLESVVRLVVPRIADWCSIHTLRADRTPGRLILAHLDGVQREFTQEVESSYSIPSDGPFGYAYVIRTARPQLIRRVDEDVLRTSRFDERQQSMLRHLGIKSSICVPVLGRGRVVAALTLAISHSEKLYDDRDLETAQELARHVSFAVDNALLYQDSQAVQEELRLANEAKDEFLGLMSHELRTPITTLYGGAKILRARGDFLDEAHKETLLSDIETEAEGMHRMIEDLLVLARAGSGEKTSTEPILVHRLIEKVVRAYQSRRTGRQIDTRYEPDVLPVMGENTYLEQILRNLLSNADKYSPLGEPVEIDVRNQGEDVVIAVLDRGSGIDPQEADLIFTRFYRAARTARGVRGMGLGLTVCKKLVEAQGGRIWAKLREGGGTEVAFALPAFTASYDEN